MRWEFQLLGGLAARCGEREVAEFRSSKGRGVLARLLLQTGERLRRAVVAAEFWPESEARSALNSLTTELSKLRQALHCDAVEDRRLLPPGQREIWIDAGLVRTDLQAFEQTVAEFDALGRRGEPAELTLARLRLCGGELLPELEGTWLTSRRTAVRQAWLRLAAGAAEGLRSAGRMSAAAALAHQAVQYYPLDEPALRFAMRLLADLGETAAALRQYEALRARLHTGYGLAPAAETSDLAADLGADLAAGADQRAEELAAAATQQIAHGRLRAAELGLRRALVTGLRGPAAAQVQRQLRAVSRALPPVVWERATGRTVVDGVVRRDGAVLLCHPAGRWSCWRTGQATPVVEGQCGDGLVLGSWLGRSAELVLAAATGELHWQSLAASRPRATAHVPGPPLALTTSPDRRWAAVGLERHGVVLWDLAHDELYELPAITRADCLAFAPNGARLAAGARSGELTVWELATGQAVWQTQQPGAVRGLAWSPDGLLLATAGGDHRARIWQWDGRGGAMQELPHGDRAVHAVAWLARGERLVSVAGDGRLRSWPGATAAGQATVVSLGGDLTRLWGHPDGHHVLALTAHGVAHLVDLAAEPAADLEAVGEGLAAVGFVGTRGDLLLVEAAGSLRQLDLMAAGPDRALLHASGCHVARAVWSPDEQRLVTAGTDGGVRVWSAAGRLEQSWQLAEVVREVVWDQSGGLLALTAEGELVALARDGLARRDHLPGAPMRHLELRPAEGLLLAASGTAVRWWSWPTFRLQGGFEVAGHCRAVALSPDARVVYVAELGGRVTARRRTGELLWERALDRAPWRLVVTASGLLVAGTSPAVLLAAADGEPVGAGWPHPGECHQVALDPAQKRVALTTSAGPVLVVDPARPQQAAVVLERRRWGLWSEFTAAGTLLAAGDDGEVREFCTASGRLLVPPRPVPALVPFLSQRQADGQITATCGDGRVYFWHAAAHGQAAPAAAPAATPVARAVWHERQAANCAQAGLPAGAWWHLQRALRAQPTEAWNCWQAALAAWEVGRPDRTAALLRRASALTSDPRPAADALLLAAWRDGAGAVAPAAERLLATVTALGRSPLAWQALRRWLVIAEWADLVRALPADLLESAPHLASAARLEVLAAWHLRCQRNVLAAATIDRCWSAARHQRSLWASAVRALALQRLGRCEGGLAAEHARALAVATASDPVWPHRIEAACWQRELTLAGG
ncbi:MAG: hypothetical protein IT204_24770 [Fimbriimonadaceae bacterium]|nr:hypothetical protein [Fimbriimonadaceae bacterium]